MSQDLQELIEVAERLSRNLQMAADNEKLLGDELALALENYSWQMHRMANEIKEIKFYCGV